LNPTFYYKYGAEQNINQFGGSFRFMKRTPIRHICPEYRHQCSQENKVIPGIEKFTFVYSYIKI
jgi:hypothetical protein